MDTAKFCEHCGKPLGSKAVHGLCPECFLKVGLGSGVAPEGGVPKPSGFVPPKPEELAAHFPQLEILELLGKGGMGAVYKARQKGLDRMVALKVLPPDSGRDPAFAERFTREAQALARLNHPNIVGVHEFGQAGQFYFFVMEFVDGVNLRQMLRAHRLAPREAMAIVPQICEALQYAHDQGIVHRDIKPENVLVDKQGRVKIADFGLAKLLGQEPQGEPLTRSAEVMGTPQYMAPEQLERPLEVDHRADIYSLGVVFYEMLTGELPLGRFAAPSKKVHIDVRLDEIVLRALEKEPELRYQQANAFKTQIETLASSTGPAPASPPVVEAKEFSDRGNQTASAGSSPPWSTTKKVGVFGLGCGGLIIVAIVALVAWGAWRLQSARESAMSWSRQMAASQRNGELARVSEAQAGANARWEQTLSFGPVIERVIQSREAGTNVFLDLDTADLLTPPPEFSSALNAARQDGDRSWRALDIPRDSNHYRYITWLGQTGADLMGERGEGLVGFDGLFAVAHGLDSAYWDDWNNLTPQQVIAATDALAWSRKAGEARRLKTPLPPAPQSGGNYTSAEQLETQSPGGPVVNHLTRAQSVTWFFQTRQGTRGILQILGRSETPPGVKVRYRQLLPNRYTAIKQAALQTSLNDTLARLRDLQTKYTDQHPLVADQQQSIESIRKQITELSNPTPAPLAPPSPPTPEAAAGTSAVVSRTFSLRHRLASDLASDLNLILSGRPGQEAKPADNNVQLTATAPPDVMNRVATFIVVQDWPSGGVVRGSDCGYLCDTVENTARSFFYACSIQDYDCISRLVSPSVLAQLKGTNLNPFADLQNRGSNAELIRQLQGDWEGKDAAIRKFVQSWNRFALRQVRGEAGVAMGFGLRRFATASFEGAPKDFVQLSFVHDGNGSYSNSLLIDTFPPWPSATDEMNPPVAVESAPVPTMPVAAAQVAVEQEWAARLALTTWAEPAPADQPSDLDSAIGHLIRRAPVRTGYQFELWEKVPGVAGEYRIRTGVKRTSIELKTGRSTLESTRAEIFYLVSSNRYYIQYDPLGASTLHYYGPFEGDPWRVLPLPGSAAEEAAHTLTARFDAAEAITAFPQRDIAMTTVAVDAARAGEVRIAKRAIGAIVAFNTRDNAARDAARELVKNGRRAEALEIARTITSFVTRDAVLRELAQ